MTTAEFYTLGYLNTLMEASARMIGRYLMEMNVVKPGNYISVGGAIAGRLRKRGLVAKVRELNAWQITRAGREALKAERGAYKR